jgi:O-antigen/teichoic acid export membrane protein
MRTHSQRIIVARRSRNRAFALGLAAAQAFSSGGNFVVGLLSARVLGPGDFGLFTLGMTVWLTFMALERAGLVQPLIVKSRSRSIDERSARLLLVSSTLVLGSASSLLVLLISFLPIGALSGVLRGLALVLLPLLLQDALRTWFLAHRRPSRAVVSDAVWAVLAPLAVYSLASALTPGMALAVWGLSAAITLPVILPGSFEGFKPRMFSIWLNQCARDAAGLSSSQGLSVLVTQGVSWLIAGVLNATNLGGVRAAQNLIAPGRLILMGAEYFFLGVIAEAADRRRALNRVISINVTVLSSWGAALLALYLVGLRPLTLLFGSEFAAFEWLVAPMFASTLIGAISAVYTLELRSRLAVKELTSMTLSTGVFRLSLLALGGFSLGLSGAVLGLVFGDFLHLLNARGRAGRAIRAAGT